MEGHVQVYFASGEPLSVPISAGSTVGDLKAVLEGLTETPALYQRLFDPSGGPLGDADATEPGQALQLVRLPAEEPDFLLACHRPWDGIGDLAWRYMAAHGADLDATMRDEDPPANPVLESEFGSVQGGSFYGSTLEHLGAAMSDGTALHFAAKNGLVDACRFLLSSEAFTKVNAKTSLRFDFEFEAAEFHLTALMVAVLTDHPDIACMLLQCKRFTEVNDSYNIGYMCHRRSAFGQAALKGYADVCAALLAHPLFRGLNDVDDYDVTVLMLAASGGTPGHAEVCRLVLQDERFTEVGLCSCTGGGWNGTALHFAAQSGLTCICQLLLQHKGFEQEHINARAPETALWRAAESGHEDVCLLILADQRFEDVMAACGESTALDVAERNGLERACQAIRGHPRFGKPCPPASPQPVLEESLAARLESVRREQQEDQWRGSAPWWSGSWSSWSGWHDGWGWGGWHGHWSWAPAERPDPGEWGRS